MGTTRQSANVGQQPASGFSARSSKLPEACSYFSALGLSFKAASPAPSHIQRRLLVLGVLARGLATDLTNYVQLELGQPLHAHDAERVGDLAVARLSKPVRFTTLDGVERDLQAGDVVIESEGPGRSRSPASMGGLGSAIGPETTSLLLEAGAFQAAGIRATSLRLGLRIDAGLRFEKKLPPALADWGRRRFLHLLLEACPSAAIAHAPAAAGDLDTKRDAIALPPGYLTERAGIVIEDALAEKKLHSPGV